MVIDGKPISVSALHAAANSDDQFTLADSSRSAMARSRAVVERVIARGDVVYGVNTGFGQLSDVQIDDEKLAELQTNLVRSHACGVGEPLSISQTRALMLLRVNVLAKGFSGARIEVAEQLIEMLNKRVTPYVPALGSVGASGDLAPLAHVALSVIGEGYSWFEGEKLVTSEAFERSGIEPLTLQAKEGLALLNGTQAIGAVGGLSLVQASWVLDAFDQAGAAALDALLGTPTAFDDRIHAARGHRGQIETAARLRALLEGSEIRDSHLVGDTRVQDAYSLRCMPQVHGAARDVIQHAAEVFEIESGAATDNPLVFADEGDVLSGGNFHAAPLAYQCDFAAIAMCDVMAISERRTDRLLSPGMNEGLTPFLAQHPGLESGLMIPHVLVAALLNESKVLATPASIDSVPTSAGKEDHVSMGMTGANKLSRVVCNAARVAAVELIAATEGLEQRRPLRSGKGVEETYTKVRDLVPQLSTDRSTSEDIERLAEAILEGVFEFG